MSQFGTTWPGSTYKSHNSEALLASTGCSNNHPISDPSLTEVKMNYLIAFSAFWIMQSLIDIPFTALWHNPHITQDSWTQKVLHQQAYDLFQEICWMIFFACQGWSPDRNWIMIIITLLFVMHPVLAEKYNSSCSRMLFTPLVISIVFKKYFSLRVHFAPFCKCWRTTT